MRTVQTTVVVLTFPAIAYLAAACERTDTPTQPRPMASIGGPTCNVPTDYPTIQAAVNDVGCTTIVVAAGTYPEPDPGPLTINRTLTLLGAQSGVDARNPRGSESIVTDPQGTIVTANNVVIDGFTIENSTAAAFTGHGILMGAGTTGTQILNNLIQNNIIGIGLANTGASQVLIQHNLIRTNNQLGPASGTGIYTDQFVAGGAASNFLIDENRFVGNDDAGIDVSHTASSVSNLDVARNEFDLNGRAILLFNTDMSSFHDNIVTNSTFASADVRILGGVDNLTVLNNDLSGGQGHGIRLTNFIGGPNTGVLIHQNNIEVYALNGLTVDVGSHVGTVDAECNWWDSPTGPTNANNPGGTGEEVVGDADFTPWLTARAPGGPCSGGLPSGKVTGGGQIDVTGGRSTFGFNAKQENGVAGGHLNYLNHFTGAHLDCTVALVTELTATTAKFQGTCSANSAASSFMAEVEDHGEPGKGNDKFKITYGSTTDGGGTIRSGNIQIHQ